MSMLLLCGIMVAAPMDARPEMIETEYVELIDHNNVISKRKPHVKRYEQMICYRNSPSGSLQIVGYLMIRPDTVYDVKRMSGNRWELIFETRSGKWRRVVCRTLHNSDTTYDPELEERKQGERGCLFGLGPWGGLRG